MTPLSLKVLKGLSEVGASGIKGRVGRGFGNLGQELLGVR